MIMFNKKLKYTLLILAIFSVINNASCVTTSEFSFPYSEEREQGYEVIDCLDERDSDGLKSLFSKKVQKDYDLDKEIDNLFNAYDGKSIWYNKLFDVAYGESIDNGVLTKRKATYWIDITTQLGFKPQYTVVVGTYSIFQDDPSKLGILYITLTDLSTDEITVIGEFKN